MAVFTPVCPVPGWEAVFWQMFCVNIFHNYQKEEEYIINQIKENMFIYLTNEYKFFQYTHIILNNTTPQVKTFLCMKRDSEI